MADLLEGTPYRTVAYLGQGSVGVVFLAEAFGSEARVAVKLLHPSLGSLPEFVTRLRRQIGALARVEHPNLVRVQGTGETPGRRTYFVMERLSGRTLADELRARGALPPGEAVDCARQALAGLGAAHAAGLVHRDVSLRNLFLASGGPSGPTTKVLDLGIAKVVGRTVGGRRASPVELDFPVEEAALYGTPRCLSPEQVLGAAADARTDVYAMGAVLYALLAGRGPFDDAVGPIELAEAHAFDTPTPPSAWSPYRIHPDLERAVLVALAKDPAKRFASAAAMSTELGRVAARMGRPTAWRDAVVVDLRRRETAAAEELRMLKIG